VAERQVNRSREVAGSSPASSIALNGKTVLVSSHVLAVVKHPIDQVVIVNKGKLVTFEH